MNKLFCLLTLLLSVMMGSAHADDAAIRQALTRLNVQGVEIQPSPVAELKTVLTSSGVFYVTEDGKHVLQGPMYDVSGAQPVNITNTLLLSRIGVPEMIVYKAAKEQYVVTIFTDITCGYCHKLHQQMKDYNALGITIRYLAFPRSGPQGQTAQDMQAVWCSKNPRQALDLAMKSSSGIEPASCHIDIKKQYALGVLLGVQGTPAMVLSNGVMIPGYQSPAELKAFLDQQKNAK